MARLGSADQEGMALGLHNTAAVSGIYNFDSLRVRV
jgi:hypothetical protein